MIGGSGSLENLLNDGWSYHDFESERLARELEAAAESEVTTELFAPFVQLSTHTIGEHLGDWPRALRLGKRVLDGRAATPETIKAWGRLYVAAMLAGDGPEAAELELISLNAAGGNFGAALLEMRFMLVGALIGLKRTGEAARLYRGALDLAGQIPQPELLDRTIAVTSNNLGWELYEMSARAAEEDALMQQCAATSLEFWLKCGNWINAERAHYLNARVANVLADPASGLAHADTALAIIAANGERPLDAALLHLARAAAFTALGDAEERASAIEQADTVAAKLTVPDLKSQYTAERGKVPDTAI